VLSARGRLCVIADTTGIRDTYRTGYTCCPADRPACGSAGIGHEPRCGGKHPLAPSQVHAIGTAANSPYCNGADLPTPWIASSDTNSPACSRRAARWSCAIDISWHCDIVYFASRTDPDPRIQGILVHPSLPQNTATGYDRGGRPMVFEGRCRQERGSIWGGSPPPGADRAWGKMRDAVACVAPK
jgi:hypothetical protein